MCCCFPKHFSLEALTQCHVNRKTNKWMRVVDVCPTIAKYLRGVDVPRNTLGVPHNVFSANYTGARSQLQVLVQSALQLRVVAAERRAQYSASRWDDEIFNAERLLQASSPPSKELERSADNLRTMLEEVQLDFMRHASPPIFELAWKVVALCVVIFWLNLFKSRRFAAWRVGDWKSRWREFLGLVLGHVAWLALLGFMPYYKFKEAWSTGRFLFTHSTYVLVPFLCVGLVFGLGRTAHLDGKQPRSFSPRRTAAVVIVQEAATHFLAQALADSQGTVHVWAKTLADTLAEETFKNSFLGAIWTLFLCLGVFQFVVAPLRAAEREYDTVYSAKSSTAAALWRGNRLFFVASASFVLLVLTKHVEALHWWILRDAHVGFAVFFGTLLVMIATSKSSHQLLAPLLLMCIASLKPDPAAQFFLLCLCAVLSWVGGQLYETPSSTTSAWPALLKEFGFIWAFEQVVLWSVLIIRTRTKVVNVDPSATKIGFLTDQDFPEMCALLMMLNTTAPFLCFAAIGCWFVLARGRHVPVASEPRAWHVLLFLVQVALVTTFAYEMILKAYTEMHDLENAFGMTVLTTLAGMLHAGAVTWHEYCPSFRWRWG
jgi:hypothetical protein